jgi:hypothetical protein
VGDSHPGDKGPASNDKGPKGFANPGAKGPKGLKGAKGLIGAPGVRGGDGSTGDGGFTGIPGFQGSTGEKGPKGLIGPKGFRGDPGPKGLEGTPGLPGNRGPTGNAGPPGPKGPIGNQGAKGPKGFKGPIGPPSDRRFKTDYKQIEDALDRVLRMRGVSFTWKEIVDGIPVSIQNLPRVGFIAQEVEEVFPQVVGELENGIKTVNYPLLIAAITEALQQQNKILNDKDREIKELELILKQKGLI